MTETTDDKLLQQFFSDNRKEIEDNGFSRRVMHHLPNRYYRISAVVELILFYACRSVVLCSRRLGSLCWGLTRNFHQRHTKRCSGTRSQITDYSGSSIGLLRISQDLFFSIKLIYSCNKSVCPYNNLVSPCLHFAGQGLIFFN